MQQLNRFRFLTAFEYRVFFQAGRSACCPTQTSLLDLFGRPICMYIPSSTRKRFQEPISTHNYSFCISTVFSYLRRVSQPGTFVRTHQKGHGSVDSEYVCLHGTAQVFMLRRLPERHKLHALSIIVGPGFEHNNLYNVPSSGMMVSSTTVVNDTHATDDCFMMSNHGATPTPPSQLCSYPTSSKCPQPRLTDDKIRQLKEMK